MRRRIALCAAALALTGCGGGSASQPSTPTFAPAKRFALANVSPVGPVEPGISTKLAFAIRKPDGAIVTSYREGSGPHTGVHLILVRDDLSTIIHLHPPLDAKGQLSTPVTLPTPGRYRAVIDAYPAGTQNFQLRHDFTASGSAKSKPLPPFTRAQIVAGFRAELIGPVKVRSIQASFLTVKLSDVKTGKPAALTPYFGALAHAIFFRAASLDYTHTHICALRAPNCSGGTAGSPAVSGKPLAPGLLRIGVILPLPGTWRLFLQFKTGGHVVTAPFTLTVT